MKKNKIISCLLVAVLCFCLTVPASASNNLDINIDTEIERALNNETDLELDYTPANATLIKEDNTLEKVKVYTTTRELPSSRSLLGNDESKKQYATTVVAKLASKNKSEVAAKEQGYVTATMTLYWTDNAGPSNDFRKLVGSWQVTTNPSTGKRPSLSDRYVGLEGRGINASNRGKVCRRHPNSNQFVIGDGEYSDGWHSYVASSSVTINKKERLSLTVKTEYF